MGEGRAEVCAGMATGPVQDALERQFALVHRIWMVGLALVLAVLFAAPRLVTRAPEDAGFARVLLLVFILVGLTDLGLGWWFKRRALDPRLLPTVHRPEDAIGPMAAQSLIAVVLTFTPTVFAFLIYLMTGSRMGSLVLCGIAIVGLLVVRPRLEEWQDALRGVRVDAHRPA